MDISLAHTASCRAAWTKRLVRRWAMSHPAEALRLIGLGESKSDDALFRQIMASAKGAAIRMVFQER